MACECKCCCGCCCVGDEPSKTKQVDCTGDFKGVGTQCGVCCVDGVPDPEIDAEGDCPGVWIPNGKCLTDPCDGACCEPVFGCGVRSKADCDDIAGAVFVGSGTSCSPDPCVDCDCGSVLEGAGCTLVDFYYVQSADWPASGHRGLVSPSVTIEWGGLVLPVPEVSPGSIAAWYAVFPAGGEFDPPPSPNYISYAIPFSAYPIAECYQDEDGVSHLRGTFVVGDNECEATYSWDYELAPVGDTGGAATVTLESSACTGFDTPTVTITLLP